MNGFDWNAPWRAPWQRITALVVREILAIWRDRRGRVVLILPPIMQLFLFTYAATFDLRDAPLAILNEDMGRDSRDLVAAFTASHAFKPVARLTSTVEIGPTIENQRAMAVLHIGPTFSRDLGAERDAAVQFIVDGRQSNTAQIALSYVNGIVETFRLEQAAKRTQPGAAQGPRLIARAWFNPNLESEWFIVPGLVADIVMIIAMVTTALSIARERELGTFEQLLVTPLHPVELFVGKIIPPAILGFAEGMLLAVLGMFFFHVPFRGDLILLVAGLAAFLISVTSLGLMVSTLTNTQQQAQTASFCVVMPLIILSGLTTPIDNMPGWIQTLTYFNPLRYVLVINRGVFLQDMPLSVAFANILPMIGIGLVTAYLSMRLFRSRMQ